MYVKVLRTVADAKYSITISNSYYFSNISGIQSELAVQEYMPNKKISCLRMERTNISRGFKKELRQDLKKKKKIGIVEKLKRFGLCEVAKQGESSKTKVINNVLYKIKVNNITK